MRDTIEIKVWLLRHNIRLDDIAAEVGVSRNFISHWIHNKRESKRVDSYFREVLKIPPSLLDTTRESQETAN